MFYKFKNYCSYNYNIIKNKPLLQNIYYIFNGTVQ